MLSECLTSSYSQTSIIQTLTGPQKVSIQGAKKIIFTACHSGKLKLTFTSPNITSASPKNVQMSRLISKFFCNLKSSKNFTCPQGKLITEFTSPMAKSTRPRLSDTTFFARCHINRVSVLTGSIQRKRKSFFLQGQSKLSVIMRCPY